MKDYVPPAPSVAEYIHRKKEALRASRERLECLSDDELRTVLRNDNEPVARLAAMGLLSTRLAEYEDRNRDTLNQRLIDLFGVLLDDVHPDFARLALHRCPLLHIHHIETARRQLESPYDPVKSEAAIALAKIKDPSILPKLLEWFNVSWR